MMIYPAPVENTVVESNRSVTRLFRDWFVAVRDAIMDLSVWREEPYANVVFTSNSGTWAVPEAGFLLCKFLQHGTKMRIAFHFTTTTVTSAGTELRFTIPNGRVSASASFIGSVSIAGTDGPALGFCASGDAGENIIRVFRGDSSAWSDSVGASAIAGTIELEVEA